MRKTFIFDLDNTLMYNFHDYSAPLLDFAKLVITRICPRSPDVPTILNLQADIDARNVKKMGFRKERFPLSMKETYKEIANTLGVKDPEGEEIAYKIGTQAFSLEKWKKQGLVEGAEETIKYLQMQNDRLILLTKGDEEIQRMKIKANDLESLFGEENIHIVPFKNEESILSLMKGTNPENVWHVGNSIKSDIIPAIKAGVGAIYIPLETWKYEKQHNGLPKYNRLIKLDEISEIKDIYPKL